MTEEKEKTLYKQQILERGWSAAMIKEFLPEPTVKDNPYSKWGTYVLLWSEDVVLEVEATEKFKMRKQAKDKRSKSAKIPVDRKIQELVDKINTYNINVKKVAEDQLIPLTLKDKNSFERQKECQYSNYTAEYYSISDNIPDEVMERFVVNFIRHELTEYDKLCNSLFAQVGKNVGLELIREKVYDAIGITYPHLAKECERQKQYKASTRAIKR